MIAAGPASSDPSTSEDALYVLEKYGMKVHEEILSAPGSETPKSLDNVTFRMAGNIAGLCRTAKRHAESRGYLTDIVTDRLEGEAAQAGRDIAKYALGEFSSYGPGLKRCLIWGGETTVRVTGGGKGGRSQELALAAAEMISGKKTHSDPLCRLRRYGRSHRLRRGDSRRSTWERYVLRAAIP